jgi:hypothetical protein
MNKFYVYEWYNVETNEIFYVGKGCNNRYKNISDRNKYFKDYISKNKVDVRIVKFFETEEEAFKYEAELTKQYRQQGFCKCNLINGGYGGYSKEWTEEMRQYMSEYNPMKTDFQRKRMSEKNPMKDSKIAQKVADKKKRPVLINGIRYDGVIDAAKEIGVWENTISNWCKRGYDTKGNPCKYIDEEQKKYTIHKTSSKAVLIDGIEYSSLREAANALGVKDTSPLCKALKANRPYKGHICKYVNQQPS